MNRRRFLGLVASGSAMGLLGCTPGEPDPEAPDAKAQGNATDAGASASEDARGQATGSDATVECGEVIMYDTNAQALYLDGTYGPLTGVILVDYVLQNQPRTLEFWHGHGGQQHRFTLMPQHFAALKRGERVYVETTEVDDHQHMLFIDPLDADYRVEGAQPVSVPLDC